MRAVRHAGDRAAGYRRGAVMGLTVAEAFMLIAFVLLLLLGVWMATARDRIAALEARAEAAERFADAFDPAQKAAALTARDHLADLGQDIGKLAAFRDLLAAASDPADAAQALSLLPVLEEGLSADESAVRVRLLDEAEITRLARTAAALDPEARRALVDLARSADLPALAALAEEGGVEGMRRDRAALALLREGDEARQAEELAAYRATGLAPAEVIALTVRAQGVADAAREARRSRAQIAATVAAQTGPVIAEVGGEVRPDGSIVFSDRLLFDAGSARITPAFDATLARLCRPWIEALHAERDAL